MLITHSVNFASTFHYCRLINESTIYLEAFETYQKRSQRNKYDIINHLGLSTLSIPLKKGKNNAQPIKSVKISFAEDWQSNHLKSIGSAYRKAPYFEHYMPLFERLISTKYDLLWDFNHDALRMIFKLLKTEIQILETEDFYPNGSEFIFPEITFPKYHQVFEDRLSFVPNASIIDLLFNLGPESKKYLVNLNMLIS
jgi:hypothetical protein